MDFVGRFEALAKDFVVACGHLNIPNAELPHVNNSKKSGLGFTDWFRRRTLPYRDMYDSRSRALVAKMYEIDVDAFKYQF